ncbi:PIN domain-containing protein [Microbacterium sp. ISL-59]|uniref:GNAT family N-acetyltransferase n=1 Tax=Microbacterium sp. ISL-59 TaxID=2819159 RepID=UPI001BEBEB05|nr:GNAT family N-acetyltransferase [Microbacterium sp. ISL-59]MBT2495819.1 PIN domain-containing protein [Microbacterium sp. ISL-59]
MDSADAALQGVLALHKANRATLGPMPDAAFRDRAKHKGLLIGRRDDQVVAYVLYDIPRHNLIKLVHLCVRADARGAGWARTLVDAAVGLHPGRSLIAATCRTDYEIDDFWRSLGMHAASERPGRALNGSILTNWVKRVNVDSGLDLLEAASLQSGLPVAILDTNIIGDLFSPPGVRRDHREESSALDSDWLQPLVSFAVSGEADNEMSRITDPAERQHLRDATSHLTRLSTRRPTDRRLEDELLAAIAPELREKDASLLSDVLHVADAIHAGADYFVTNDGNVHRASAGWEVLARGLRVVRPHELIGALTPESFVSDFRSRLIDDSDLEWTVLSSVDPALEGVFRVFDVEARPADFDRRIRELLARPKQVTVQKLTDGDGRLWALAAVSIDRGVLRLPLLRAMRGERGGTVAFQLVRHFRRVAWEHGATSVEVTDPAISATIDAALDTDGFTTGSPRTATMGPATASRGELGIRTATDVTIWERTRWPLVVTDAALPTYLIPIQPKWASRLLAFDDGLFSVRRRGLGLSRELVYFSGSKLRPRALPARVLWYASSDKGKSVSRIVARSVMVDAVRVPVKDAVERFANLGVLRTSDIQAASGKDGIVSVIRFQDTERLSQSVSRHDDLFRKHVKGEVQSMRSVDPEFFDAVLRLQTGESRVV